MLCVCSKHCIESSGHVFKLDETAGLFGREKMAAKNRRVVSEACWKMTFTRLGFNYELRISFLVCVCADGTKPAPAVLFCSVRDPWLSTGFLMRSVRHPKLSEWKSFTLCDVTSVYANLLDWIDIFIRSVRDRKFTENSIVYFNNAVRSQ